MTFIYGQLNRKMRLSALIDGLNANPPARGQAFDVREYGARGDGVTDDTAAVAAAIAAARALRDATPGTEVVFPNGTYVLNGPIDLKNAYCVTLRGTKGPRAAGNNFYNDVSLKFTQGGAGNCVDARSSTGTRLLDLSIANTNPAFTGRIVNLDGGVTYDTQFAVVSGCEITGTQSACNAAYGVTLSQAINSQIRDCLFSYVGFGVAGMPAAAYSNGIQIENNQFWNTVHGAIWNADEAWLIKGNVFEGNMDGTPSGYKCDCMAIGPVTFESNWFGDNSPVGTGSYIQYAGGPLVLIGNLFGAPPASGAAVQVGVAGAGHIVVGLFAAGNRFLADRCFQAIGTTGGGQCYNLVMLGNQINGPNVLIDPGAPGLPFFKNPLILDSAYGVPFDFPVNGQMLVNGKLAIGTNFTAPPAGAVAEFASTTAGVLFPRMTTAQRNAIASPPDGLVVYNTTLGKLQVRAASVWADLN